MKEVTKREFLSLVVEKATTACWSWAGQYGDDGRPVFRLEGAYRWAYRIYVGPIPYGYDVHHTCENSKCVNSKHLVALPAEIHQQVHEYLRAGKTLAAEYLYRRARLGEFSSAVHPDKQWRQVENFRPAGERSLIWRRRDRLMKWSYALTRFGLNANGSVNRCGRDSIERLMPTLWRGMTLRLKNEVNSVCF